MSLGWSQQSIIVFLCPVIDENLGRSCLHLLQETHQVLIDNAYGGICPLVFANSVVNFFSYVVVVVMGKFCRVLGKNDSQVEFGCDFV